ncbi:Hypothetical predicted protein, partial [Paramuricea clavata]
HDVTSQSVIYVSRAKGNDSTSCGSQYFPCYSISRAVSQVQFGSSIFLDSTNTTMSPYDCLPLTSHYKGIYVITTLSFVGGPSLAHVSCRKGLNWIVNGTDSAIAIEVNFTGIAFQNSRLHFIETSATVTHCVFSNTENPVVNFTVLHRNQTSLSFQNVLFESNVACISMTSSSVNTENMLFISIHIRNSVFNNNGPRRFPFLPPSWTILGVDTSGTHFLDIRIKNSSFQGNYVRSSGMISVKNQPGHTKFLIQDVAFIENGLHDTGARNSLFMLSSSIISLVISKSQVKKSKQRLLSMYSTWTEINVSHTTVDDFINSWPDGGTFHIESNIMKLLIKYCLFSNGKSNPGHGGLLFVSARNTSILIENSILTNLTTAGYGGVIYATARQNVAASMKLNTTNSSFVSNGATQGGVIYLHQEATSQEATSPFFVQVFIQNSLFEGNTASTGGCVSVQGVEFLLTGKNVTFTGNSAGGPGGVMNLIGAGVMRVSVSHVLFKENSAMAGPGGVFYVTAPQSSNDNSSFFNLTASHVQFVGNSAGVPGGVLYIELGFRSILIFNDVVFLKNTAEAAGPGGAIYATGDGNMYPSFQILIKRGRFENNTALVGGAIYVQRTSNAEFTSEDSIFRSNVAYLPGGALYLQMLNSTITLVNTTFSNNTSVRQAGGAVYLDISDESKVHIALAKFERNYALHSFGAGLAISTSGDTLRESGCSGKTWRAWNYNNYVEIKNTHFKNNVAARGGALSMTDGSVNFINCTFLDNFASNLEGDHLINYGTNNLNLTDCTFRQTRDVFSSFIQTYSAGPLVLTNTTIDQQASRSSITLTMVSKGGLVEFNDFTSIVCPSGMFVSKLNLSYNDWINSSCSLDVTVLRLQCKECERGTYSLQRGCTEGLRIVNDFACLSCPHGAECLPTIKSKTNFWGYLIDDSPPALNFTLCPDSYCLPGTQNPDGYNSCYGKREGWMCGRCAPGYSETLFSTACKRSEDCNDNWFWLVFLALVFIMASFLVFKPPIVTFAAKHAFWFKNCVTKKPESVIMDETESLASLRVEGNESTFLLSTEEIENEKLQAVGYLEIIFYFYQISNLLLTSTSIEKLLKAKVLIPVQGFFNFQERYLVHQICPFSGLTAETKQLFEVAPVFGTLGAIYFIYVLHYVLCKISRTATPTVGHYLGATMETMLLEYIKIANVSLSLIRCVPVGSESRWFYNGTIVCYQWWQIVLIAFDVVVVVPFIFVLAWGAVKLQRGKVSARHFLLACVFPLPFLILWLLQSSGFCGNQHDDQHAQNTEYTEALKAVLLAPFRVPEAEKSGALYWESIFIVRRFIL